MKRVEIERHIATLVADVEDSVEYDKSEKALLALAEDAESDPSPEMTLEELRKQIAASRESLYGYLVRIGVTVAPPAEPDLVDAFTAWITENPGAISALRDVNRTARFAYERTAHDQDDHEKVKVVSDLIVRLAAIEAIREQNGDGRTG